jgi:hypothetical protein
VLIEKAKRKQAGGQKDDRNDDRKDSRKDDWDRAHSKVRKPKSKSQAPSSSSDSSSDSDSGPAARTNSVQVRTVHIRVARAAGSSVFLAVAVQEGIVDGNAATPKVMVEFLTEKGTRGFRFEATPDTGATRSIFSFDLVRRHGLRPRRDRTVCLQAANGEYMRC